MFKTKMKHPFLMATVAVLSGAMLCQAATKEDLADPMTRHSYGLGANYGSMLKKQNVEIHPDVFFQGLQDALGEVSLMSPQEIQTAMKEISEMLRARKQAEQEALAAKNLEEGKAFLDANKDKEGVVTLASGLQYKVLKEGTGPVPTASDNVKVHYRGTFIDGKEFDSSHKRGAPASFNVTGVIRGWTEALQKMAVGAKWQLFIPAELAYGARGNSNIPPNSTLLFEVELMDITTPPKPAVKKAPITSDIIKVPSAKELEKGAKIEVIKKEEVDEYIAREREKGGEKAESGNEN